MRKTKTIEQDIVGLSLGLSGDSCICCGQEGLSGIGIAGKFICNDCIGDIIEFVISCMPTDEPIVHLSKPQDIEWICDGCGVTFVQSAIGVAITYEPDTSFNRNYCMPCYVKGIDAMMEFSKPIAVPWQQGD